MIRRPPRSTPFPTRRSSDLIPAAAAPRAPLAEFLFNTSFEVDGWWLFGGDVVGEYSTRAAKEGARSAMVGVHRDRKSTRLNSSHANISYAVFCLKKKTQHSL